MAILVVALGPSSAERAEKRHQREIDKRERQDEADRRYRERMQRRLGDLP